MPRWQLAIIVAVGLLTAANSVISAVAVTRISGAIASVQANRIEALQANCNGTALSIEITGGKAALRRAARMHVATTPSDCARRAQAIIHPDDPLK